MPDLNAMLAGYLECALWASTDNSDESGGDPLDDNYFVTDIAEESQTAARQDCTDFLHHATEHDIDLDALYPRNSSGIGHDLWLTRNYHGVGFWDRGHGKPGDILSDLAHGMGGSDAYVGDDGKVYLS
jgi:hypothetical protein